MKPEECLAKIYLESLDLGPVIYEPKGNRPPDFSVDNSIAVEVRRLNQNEITETGYRGLEETRIPLWARVGSLLASFGPPKSGVSWFVSYDFRRPLPEWKTLSSLLRKWRIAFRNKTPNEGEVSVDICHHGVFRPHGRQAAAPGGPERYYQAARRGAPTPNCFTTQNMANGQRRK